MNDTTNDKWQKLESWIKEKIEELEEQMQEHEELHLPHLREKAYCYKRMLERVLKKMEQLND